MTVQELAEKLRTTESRSKRELLDEAAWTITVMAKTMWGNINPCEACANQEKTEECPDVDSCWECDHTCCCHNCNGANWTPVKRNVVQ